MGQFSFPPDPLIYGGDPIPGAVLGYTGSEVSSGGFMRWTVGVYGQFMTLKCINCFLMSIFGDASRTWWPWHTASDPSSCPGTRKCQVPFFVCLKAKES